MADFQACVNYVIKHEIIDDNHTLSKNPNDPGGTTNYGISLRFLRALDEDSLKRVGIFTEVTEETVVELTRDQAIKIYYNHFWTGTPFDKIQNGIIGKYIFDMAVHHGLSQAVRIVQRACCCAQKVKDFIKVDAIFGSHTIQAVNQASFTLIPVLISERTSYMRQLVAENPKLDVFLDGWITRAFDI